jgi:hypothetical protein
MEVLVSHIDDHRECFAECNRCRLPHNVPVILAQSIIFLNKTVAMFLARILFSHLHESPRFLVHVGRNKEAAVALSEIAKYNGDEMRIALADVDDSEENVGGRSSSRPSRFRSFSIDGEEDSDEGDALLANAMPVNRRRPSTGPLLQNSNGPPNRSPMHLIRRSLTLPLKAWYRRIAGLLTGEWKVRTLLIWGIWMSLALGNDLL